MEEIMGEKFPIIGSRYTNDSGDAFEVIGMGTQGIIVEYIDGRAELIDHQTWDRLRFDLELGSSTATVSP